MNNNIHFLGRILLAIIFIMAGFGKIADTAGTAAYMQSAGLPALLVWPTIALEVLGGLALIVGFQTRITAWALAAFTVLAAALFHNDFSNQMQMIMFLKNLSITGGLLILSAQASYPLSIDNRKA